MGQSEIMECYNIHPYYDVMAVKVTLNNGKFRQSRSIWQHYCYLIYRFFSYAISTV